MRFSSSTISALLILTSVVRANPLQHSFTSDPTITTHEARIHSILERYSDPVEAMIAFDPSTAMILNEPRLLEVMNGTGTKWMTEGDKLYILRIFVNEEKEPPLAVTTYKTSKLKKYGSL